MSGQRIAHGCRGRDTGVRAPSGMKNPAKTFAQIGVSRARAGTFGRVFGIGKAGSGLDTIDSGGSPRDRAALTSARSRTSPHEVVSVDVSLFQFIRENCWGFVHATVLPRSRHTAANDAMVRVLAPVDTIREVRESSRRAVVHARLLGASHRRGCSSQNRRGFGRETTLAPDGSRP